MRSTIIFFIFYSLVQALAAQGNVGIGTSFPARKLHVVGNTLLVNPTGVALETAGKVGIGVTNPVYKFEVNGTSYFESASGPSLLVGSGNVGIGTSNPTYKFNVHGGANDAFYCSSEAGRGIYVYTSGTFPSVASNATNGAAAFLSSSNNYCLFMHQGASGWSTGMQGILLKDGGDEWKMYIDVANDYNFAYGNALRAWISDTDGAYYNSSDRALKKNIRSKTGVLQGLLQLQAYTYHLKGASDDSPFSLGFMADEVAAQFPELVSEKEGFKALCYDHFAVLSVEAIKEQQVMIDALKKEVAEIKAVLNEVKAMMVGADER